MHWHSQHCGEWRNSSLQCNKWAFQAPQTPAQIPFLLSFAGHGSGWAGPFPGLFFTFQSPQINDCGGCDNQATEYPTAGCHPEGSRTHSVVVGHSGAGRGRGPPAGLVLHCYVCLCQSGVLLCLFFMKSPAPNRTVKLKNEFAINFWSFHICLKNRKKVISFNLVSKGQSMKLQFSAFHDERHVRSMKVISNLSLHQKYSTMVAFFYHSSMLQFPIIVLHLIKISHQNQSPCIWIEDDRILQRQLL